MEDGTQTLQPLGGGEPYPVDIRLVSATNRPLRQDVDAGLFRADLYYRINVVSIFLPPLRERREDIPLLLTHFAELAGLRTVDPADRMAARFQRYRRIGL